MTDKELRKLNRAELLEMLIAQMKENDALREQLEAALRQLESREIKISKAGSIAEAALQLNGIFEAADAAAKQYLANVQSGNRQQADCAQLEEETRKKCDEMIAAAEKRCAARERATEARCRELVAQLQKLRENQLGSIGAARSAQPRT